MARAIDIIRKVAPKARNEYRAAFEHGDALLQEHGITTPLQLAHFLAQVLHESGGLTLQWESGNYSAQRLMQIFGVGKHSAGITASEAERLARNGPAIFERVYGLGNPKKAKDLGNTQPGDGYRYRGGGIMQTTGRYNYRKMGEACGVDFEKYPELVCSAEHALKPALAEWTKSNLNTYADNNDIWAISRAINLGNPKSSRTPNGMKDREFWFNKVRPLIKSVEFLDDVPIPGPVPVEPETKPAVKSTTNWAAGGIIGAIGTLMASIGDALTDWRFLLFIAVMLLAAYIIWERNGKPDIAGWFRQQEG